MITEATRAAAANANRTRWDKYRAGRASILRAEDAMGPFETALERCVAMAAKVLESKRGHIPALYETLALCLDIAVNADCNPLISAKLNLACQDRMLIIEAGGDACLRICRIAFDADPVRANMYRYAIVLRRAKAADIESADLAAWLRRNGGIKALSYTGEGQELARLRWIAEEAENSVKIGKITPELRRAVITWLAAKHQKQRVAKAADEAGAR